MAPDYRLLVLDVDGTLVDARGNIAEADREALARVRADGVMVALSTGRSFRSCRRVLERLSLDSYHIFFDGAVVGNHDLS
ncbi:MAG: HAD family hydrolase, partial [Chloroflexota bacterium]